MPTTFPATRAEPEAKRSEETAPHGGCLSNRTGAPTFALLEARGPRPGALVASCGLLSAMLALAVTLGRTLRTPHVVSETVVSPTELWLPPNPSPDRSDASATDSPEGPEQLVPPATSLPLDQPAPASVEPDPPSASTASQLSVLPLPPSDALSPAFKLAPYRPLGSLDQETTSGVVAAPTGQAKAANPNPAPGTLGTVPLPQLLERQTALANSLAALPSHEREALPQVSIRVNAEWLRALPQTQEKLYFSLVPPQPDSLVLTYSPLTGSLTLERPERPLWQIRDAQRVPELAGLRAQAARRLGVAPEFVGLYTWHPPNLENALLMFVATRIKQTGARLSSHDIVTVRLASGAGGFVMNLEPAPIEGLR